jgi:8-oxo-dGTP pyrophosphatase MutT (NUDIX family)
MTESIFETARRELNGYIPQSQAQQMFLDRVLDLVNSSPEAFKRSSMGHVTASAVVIREGDGAVLLTLHPKYSRWLQLGGHLEPDDSSIVEAALREASEESGIANLIAPSGIVDIDIHSVPCPREGSAHFDVRVLVVAEATAMLTMSDESDDLAWFAPGYEPEGLDPALVRAIAAARALASQ